MLIYSLFHKGSVEKKAEGPKPFDLSYNIGQNLFQTNLLDKFFVQSCSLDQKKTLRTDFLSSWDRTIRYIYMYIFTWEKLKNNKIYSVIFHIHRPHHHLKPHCPPLLLLHLQSPQYNKHYQFLEITLQQSISLLFHIQCHDSLHHKNHKFQSLNFKL